MSKVSCELFLQLKQVRLQVAERVDWSCKLWGCPLRRLKFPAFFSGLLLMSKRKHPREGASMHDGSLYFLKLLSTISLYIEMVSDLLFPVHCFSVCRTHLLSTTLADFFLEGAMVLLCSLHIFLPSFLILRFALEYIEQHKRVGAEERKVQNNVNIVYSLWNTKNEVHE